jgi:hypothetical protein
MREQINQKLPQRSSATVDELSFGMLVIVRSNKKENRE